MAMKKDDDKSKKTLSGKKPATFGGANSKLIKPKASAPSGPRAEPSRPMGRDASGSANFDRTSSSRATVSVGPATLSMGGRTAKSKGGMDMSKGKVQPKKSVNPTAKTSGVSGGGFVAPSTPKGAAANLAKQEIAAKRNRNLAIGIGGSVLGTGVMLAGGGKKIKQAAKYIGDTKERKERKRVQKAENEAMIVERNKGKATVKASKRTMEGLKRAKKGQ
jgi:hypothetical protein